jgi:hypothetical protein
MAIDQKTTKFEQKLFDAIDGHVGVQLTSYSRQDSAPNYHGFTATFDGETYEVVITRTKTKRVL